MTRHYELGQLVAQAQQRLQRILQDAAGLAADLTNIQSLLPAPTPSYKLTPAEPVTDPSTRIAIANGHRLTDADAQTVDKDAYDVVLDMAASTLRYRENPEQRSELRLANLQATGPHRIKILAIMMERFGTPLWAEKADELFGEFLNTAQSEAFTKSISVLRRSLGGGGRGNAYIESVRVWQSPRSGNACAYQLCPKWKYLLITHERNLTGQP